ncbi:MAG: hypothetical protein DRP83_02100 [Planctomycetota bacterium]|nr:MAG: hypothetical protein DRP83_02100 [Planctomycetota bacterium]
MSLFSRLIKVGSIAQSMSVYLPAMVFQKALGMARVVLFTYFVSLSEMGIWGAGVMVFILGGSVVTLGTHHGMGRYVSLYESRGQLWLFFKRVWLGVLAIVLLMGTAGFFLRQQCADWLILPSLNSQLPPGHLGQICLVVLGNVLLMGLHMNMISFMYGLRVYRLVSVVEIFFSVVFTVAGLAAVQFEATALTILYAHLGALVLTLTLGLALLRAAVLKISRLSDSPDAPQLAPCQKFPQPDFEPISQGDADTLVASAPTGRGELDELAEETGAGGMLRFLKFGFVGMLSALVWLGAGYVSYFLALRQLGQSSAGLFHVIMKLAQPLLFLANAAWAVIFSHVAKRWESGDRPGAIYTLETAFKVVTLVVMTLTVLLYVTAPIWIRVLQVEYRAGYYCLPGLLMFFMAVSNLTILGIPAKLHERPIVIAIAGLVGGGLNALLALLWMPQFDIVGAARAAGVGMYFGGGVVMLVYLLISKTRLHDSTYFLLATPALLLLPSFVVGPIWILLLTACIFSPWFFDAGQKRLLRSSVRKLWQTARRFLPWR